VGARGLDLRVPNWAPAFRLRAVRFGGLRPDEARKASVGGPRGQHSRKNELAPAFSRG